MAMKSRLEKLIAGDELDPGASDNDFNIYALHSDDELSKAPLCLAFVSERAFPLEPLGALHLDQILTSPGPSPLAKGAGRCLLQFLATQAGEARRLMTLEPQSAALEEYFAQIGFRASKELDPYLFFLAADEADTSNIEVRFALGGAEAHERLLAAFKRPPCWLASSEEFFITARQDRAALDVLRLRVRRFQAQQNAWIHRFEREAPTKPYRAGAGEEVELADAMSVMRGPEFLAQVAWATAQGLGSGASAPSASLDGGKGYAGLGRCSLSHRAYPLPGLSPEYGPIELVIDSLELPMRSEAVYSAWASCKPVALAEVLEVTRSLFKDFRVQAVLFRNPPSWTLEVAQTDGLVAATLLQHLSEDAPEPGDDF